MRSRSSRVLKKQTEANNFRSPQAPRLCASNVSNMVLPPTQYMASRQLDRICDMRVSIGSSDYVDSDPWGRAHVSAPAPRFASRAAAERSLTALAPKLHSPPTPATVNIAARRTLRHSRIAKEAANRSNNKKKNNNYQYQQPPQPPPHLQLRDASRDSANPGDVKAPPPGPSLTTSRATVPNITFDTVSSERISDPPSFANLRDLSITSSSRSRSPPGTRRPRGSNMTSNSNSSNTNAPVKRAALAEYLEINDEAIIERVFDDADEPTSATGAGSVASVPQSPFRLKRWMGKINGNPSGSHSSLPEGDYYSGTSPKKKSANLRDSVSRLLSLDPAPESKDNNDGRPSGGLDSVSSAPRSFEPKSFEPKSFETKSFEPKSFDPNSMGSIEEETPTTAVYEMVMLKTNIPDRPRASDPGLIEDDLEYFDDVGDVALGEHEEELHDYDDDHHHVRVNPMSDKPRPKLQEHIISSIKSYHGPNDDYDDDDYADGEYTDDESETNTASSLSYGPKSGKSKIQADAVFEESDISHSFDQPSNLQLNVRSTPSHRRPPAMRS